MRILPKEHEWTPYLWLIYLVYFLIVPFALPFESWIRVATVAGTAVALPLYFWGYWLRGRRVLWASAGFLILGTLFAPINPGASVFYVYAAAYLGRTIDAPEAYRWLAGLLLIIAAEAWILHLPASVWVSAMVFSIIVGAAVIHQSQKQRLMEKLLAARGEAERLAKVAERERIARDLHDLLGHTLSLIVLKSELASRLTATDAARAAEEIRDVERISRDALAQVRSAVRGYRSAGFENELKEAQRALRTAGIEVETEVDTPPLPAAVESVFTMALREAVTNVVRHAQATFCRLSLRRNGSYCELEIVDNGRGGALEEGSGLSGMRERVEALGGALERDGSRGTLLRIRVPV